MKYWKEIIIALLLAGNIYLQWSQSKEVARLEKETKEYQVFVLESLATNNKILEETLAARDSLDKALKNKDVIIVTQKEYYETYKKSPTNTNFTSGELSDWVKSLESEAKSNYESIKKSGSK